MDVTHPRYSTSEALLKHALAYAQDTLQVETQCIPLRELQFRPCEGFYSKSARACTWPCSITQMDPSDQLDRVYEAFVHWADVILVATPIRWGAASSLYYIQVNCWHSMTGQSTFLSPPIGEGYHGRPSKSVHAQERVKRCGIFTNWKRACTCGSAKPLEKNSCDAC